MMRQAESVAPGNVAALAVMTFAGIRPAEALRLTWKSVDIERKTISLMGNVTKTRTTRHVDIAPNLLQWLARYKGEGPLVRSAGGFRGDRERIMQALGIGEWPNDVLRHTAATEAPYYAEDAAGWRGARRRRGTGDGRQVVTDPLLSNLSSCPTRLDGV